MLCPLWVDIQIRQCKMVSVRRVKCFQRCHRGTAWHGLATWQFNQLTSLQQQLLLSGGPCNGVIQLFCGPARNRPASRGELTSHRKADFSYKHLHRIAELRLSYQLDVEYSRSCHCTAPSLSVPKIFCLKSRGLWSVPTENTKKLQKLQEKDIAKPRRSVLLLNLC